MPDVFISYSARDSDLARWLHDQLVALQITTFLAELSVAGGQDWKPEVLNNLRESQFVLFLATPASCASDAVKHEIGAALILQKVFVPLMAGIRPHELPDWVKDKQAVDIQDAAGTRRVFEHIAEVVTSKRFVAGAIAAVVVLGGLYLLLRKK